MFGVAAFRSSLAGGGVVFGGVALRTSVPESAVIDWAA